MAEDEVLPIFEMAAQRLKRSVLKSRFGSEFPQDSLGHTGERLPVIRDIPLATFLGKTAESALKLPTVAKNLVGAGEGERGQLWPEKMVRNAAETLSNAASGNVPVDWDERTEYLLPGAMDI